ncbi:ATP-binding protein [Priestia megaterium]|uniref:ATP-binding protein n=1 Tax=Priestia megaterium TaxID=1404 RepID=UPI000472AE54|nr:ATP-binding protein [Priestia megaterium]MCM3020972.1 ATP-binding protein [Priestia megaterium]MCM3186100.1 ATP-binding protein [Priestia megaterium]MED3917027.1 ATP-binding protein [Priestia megaterium]PFR97397.1 two-component sensor histidine kinase [Priestia megaterium]
MNQLFRNMSFRSQILTILLLITFMLSGFSLVLVHAVDKMNHVSNEIKDEDVPQMVWLSYWEEQLNIKEYIVKNNLKNPTVSLIEEYQSYDTRVIENNERYKQPVPKSLIPLKEKIELLDFKISNNVQGLLKYGDIEGAKEYLKGNYLPDLHQIKKDINSSKEETVDSLDTLSDTLSVIIKDSLILLLILTVSAIVASLYASYRMSASLTKPIEQMIEKVNDIADGEYGLVLQDTKQIELKQLSASINQMSVSLEDSFWKIIKDKAYRQQILNSLPVGIITMEDETNSIFANTSAKQFLDLDEKDICGYMEECPEYNTEFWSMLNSGEIHENKKVLFGTKKMCYCFLASQTQLFNEKNESIGRIFYFIDISDTEELEKRMHQSEKLALVGEVAAGAAHEIRNPLAVIHGFISLMNQSLSDEEKKRFYLPLLMKELERINYIIEEMLLLSKPGTPVMKKVSMQEIINELLPLITHSSKFTEKDKLIFDVKLQPYILKVDEKQIKQVLHNLIRNSMEAMDGEGVITIYSQVHEDSYCLYIEDTGKGIPLHMQQSLYQPFSTSKDSGTGLGLPIAQRILESHGGQIKLLSTSSRGTVFVIKFPLH